MTINYLAIFLATVAQFICGAVWYTALFGKLWGKMHDFDKLSKSTQKEMMRQMGPFYALQFVVTVLMVVVTYILLPKTNINPYLLGFMLWLGFVVPTQTSSVIFGGTPAKWVVKKILVQAGSALVCLLAGIFTLQLFG